MPFLSAVGVIALGVIGLALVLGLIILGCNLKELFIDTYKLQKEHSDLVHKVSQLEHKIYVMQEKIK